MPTTESTYSSWVGTIYVFNLIIGTGALTLPATFARAGWLLSTIILLLSGFISFISATFIVESIACTNATIQWRRVQSLKMDEDNDDISIESDEETNEETAIIPNTRNRSKYYSLNQSMELGRIANLYFNRIGVILFYTSLCIYLYGDLAIYCTSVGKSLTMVICPAKNDTAEVAQMEIHGGNRYDNKCWEEASLTRNQVYQICVIIFVMTLGPFAFFNVQKTKYIQMFTTTMRWCAFSLMVVLACIRIYVKGPETHHKVFEIAGISSVMGASVYSYMCHHSLPNIVAPFSNKRHVIRQLLLVYVLICIFYLLLSLTGIYAFADVYDLYTLNFVPHHQEGAFLYAVAYFLNLFPVFTLATSLPIIAVTLQTNLKNQFLNVNTIDNYPFVLRRLTFPTIALLPPTVVALLTHNINFLVKITGAYAGVCIQHFIPAFLVLFARQQCQVELGNAPNPYASKFQSKLWIVFIIIMGILSVIFVTVNFFQ